MRVLAAMAALGLLVYSAFLGVGGVDVGVSANVSLGVGVNYVDYGGGLLAASLDNGTVAGFYPNMSVAWSLNLSRVGQLDWGPVYLAVASGSSIYFITVEGRAEYRHDLPGPVTGFSWGPGSGLAAVGPWGLSVVEPGYGEAWSKSFTYTPISVAWDNVSGLIAVGTVEDKRVSILDDDGDVLDRYLIGSTPVSLSWSPTGYILAVGTDTGRLVVLDAAQGILWARTIGSGWSIVAWGPLIAVAAGEALELYTSEGERVWGARLDGSITSLSWNGSLLAVALGDSIIVYNVSIVPPPPETITVTVTETTTETVTETVTTTVVETTTETVTETVTSIVTETVSTTQTVTETITATTTATETVTETRVETVTSTVTETLETTRTVTTTETSTVAETVTTTETVTESYTTTTTETVTRTLPVTVTREATKTLTETVTERLSTTIPITLTETIITTVTVERGYGGTILAVLAALVIVVLALLRLLAK